MKISSAERLRSARRSTITVGKFKFVVRRPTQLEMIEARGKISGEQLLTYLVDWEGVKESDLFEHGDPHPEPFDGTTAREWLADRPDLFSPIAQGIFASYNEHAEKLEAATKNSQAGSTT